MNVAEPIVERARAGFRLFNAVSFGYDNWVFTVLPVGPPRYLGRSAQRDKVMAILSVYCVWCAEHAFQVDEITLEATGILVMKCSKCGKPASVGFDGGTRELLILPGGPESKEREQSECRP